MRLALGLLVVLAGVLWGHQAEAADSAAKVRVKVRVGHFPNLTHAQALVGHHLSREGKGWFEKRLGTNVVVEWYVFNAGPSAFEGMFGRSIDLIYVGPSPTINAHLQSKGEEVRVVAGACSGGVSLVVGAASGITNTAQLKGRVVATPQLGNTQDVAARHYLKSLGFDVRLSGGDVHVVPTSPASQLVLFRQGKLDASWAVEPWVSRFVAETRAKVLMDESVLWPETGGRFVTTHLACRAVFLKENREIVRAWVKAHEELTDWLKSNPVEARRIVNEELKLETGRGIAPAVLKEAWGKVEFTVDPLRLTLERMASNAYSLGLTRHKPALERLYHLEFISNGRVETR